MIDEVTLKNFRCFRERQTVPLAQLTLLVGENSTGKTSFLALLRSLQQLAYYAHVPTFKDPPYDLGNFDEIAYNPRGAVKKAHGFEAGFRAQSYRTLTGELIEQPHRFHARFGRSGAFALPTLRRLSFGNASVESSRRNTNAKLEHVTMTTPRGKWSTLNVYPPEHGGDRDAFLFATQIVLGRHDAGTTAGEPLGLTPINNSPDLSDGDKDLLRQITQLGMGTMIPAAFAGAPMRSQPRRTYDPAPPTPDTEGSYVPLYLNDLRVRDHEAWKELRSQLQEFGDKAQLFDDLSLESFGDSSSNPFQLQVRTPNTTGVSPYRNILDVGYGVSQVLPVATELLRSGRSDLYLLQQPEVHLHPSAQAALGTLLCQVAAAGRQLIVETHSDHLIDRVRMDVRDGTTNLKPEDVSLLYFERTGLDVCIHPIRFDKLGNVLDAPPGYRQFFLEEVNRSLGL